METKKLCPSCLHELGEYPALSRRDNETEVCSDCGTWEAMYQFQNGKKLPPFKIEIVSRFMDEFVNGYNSAKMYLDGGVSVNIDEYTRKLVTDLVRDHVDPTK